VEDSGVCGQKVRRRRQMEIRCGNPAGTIGRLQFPRYDLIFDLTGQFLVGGFLLCLPAILCS
jgi:hypothetical protein